MCVLSWINVVQMDYEQALRTLYPDGMRERLVEESPVQITSLLQATLEVWTASEALCHLGWRVLEALLIFAK